MPGQGTVSVLAGLGWLRRRRKAEAEESAGRGGKASKSAPARVRQVDNRQAGRPFKPSTDRSAKKKMARRVKRQVWVARG